MTDGLHGRATEFADTLSDRVGHAENLIALLVKQQMVVTKMGTAHVPVEILGLQIKCERVRQDGIHGAGHIIRGIFRQVGWGTQAACSLRPSFSATTLVLFMAYTVPFIRGSRS